MTTAVNSLPGQGITRDMQLVVFSLGSEEFGADIAQIREIIRPGEITVLPQAPDFTEGIINLRGQITTIINLRQLMGMDSKAIDSNTRIIVVENGSNIVGLLVDRVTEVVNIRGSQVEPLSGFLQNHSKQCYILGVCKLKQLLILVDLQKALSSINR